MTGMIHIPTSFVYVWMRYTTGAQTQIWSFIIWVYYFTPVR